MWTRARIKDASGRFSRIPVDEEVVFNLDHIIAWKGKADGPAEVLLTSGEWVKLHTTAKMMEVLTGTFSGTPDATFKAKGSN